MINAVGREIPDELLKDGLKVYQSPFDKDGERYKKAAPVVKTAVAPRGAKLKTTLREALEACDLKDGMCVSFHHHFRNGDFVCAMTLELLREMGYKDLFVCASSLGKAQANIVPMMEDGTVTRISSSGLRDEVGRAISQGKLRHPAWIRSHGGRVRAIESGDLHIDLAIIGASTADAMGNASGKGGKADCGVLSYADVDARYADQVIVVTDTLVPVPNFPASIEGITVDYVVELEKIGDPTKIASGAIRTTDDPRELMLAENCAKVVANTEWFVDGFSFQTGAGGPSLAVTDFLRPYMDERGIQMGWAMGGITEPLVRMLHDGYIRKLVNDQAFDIPAIRSVHSDPNHFEISCSQYANPFNKGAFVNYLDYVILGALEIDVDFNVNVVQGSDGVIQGAPGGHVDTAAGAALTIVVAPLLRGRIATVRREVTSITTPGATIDVLVTDYGIAVNPLRRDVKEQLLGAGIELTEITELARRAEAIAGVPEPLKFTDDVVALVEYRDGTIIDVIYGVEENMQ